MKPVSVPDTGFSFVKAVIYTTAPLSRSEDWKRAQTCVHLDRVQGNPLTRTPEYNAGAYLAIILYDTDLCACVCVVSPDCRMRVT